ncbi:MAG: hypothetical protein QM763_06155 [Agriterribacter sp.]
MIKRHIPQITNGTQPVNGDKYKEDFCARNIIPHLIGNNKKAVPYY